MSKRVAFLFDLDGVIVDSARFHYVAWKRLANSLGVDFDEARNEQLKGVSRVESLNLILQWGNKSLDDQAFQAAMDQKNQWYLELVTTLTQKDLLPGSLAFLEETKAKGIAIALGSASKNAPMILDQLQITSLFDAVIDGNKVTQSKPNPEVFLKGAEAVQVDPVRCVVFEDAPAGVEAAHAGGMKCVGISPNQNGLSADIVVSNLAQITVNDVIRLIE